MCARTLHMYIWLLVSIIYLRAAPISAMALVFAAQAFCTTSLALQICANKFQLPEVGHLFLAWRAKSGKNSAEWVPRGLSSLHLPVVTFDLFRRYTDTGAFTGVKVTWGVYPAPPTRYSY